MINLKNKIWILLIIIAIIGIGIYFFVNKQNSSDNENYKTSKISTESEDNISTNNNIEKNDSETKKDSSNYTTNILDNPENIKIETPPQEVEIAKFSTKIYDKTTERQNNVNITCSTLNDTIVPNGSTFSFCNTIGPSTTAKGYQKADIFDKYGNKKKGLGGGNCQVSTTLYNAILNVPNLTITERHEHSNKVPYIQNGKDAAVAYGSYDLKFVNNTGNNIKIKASTDSGSVNISLLKII